MSEAKRLSERSEDTGREADQIRHIVPDYRLARGKAMCHGR